VGHLGELARGVHYVPRLAGLCISFAFFRACRNCAKIAPARPRLRRSAPFGRSATASAPFRECIFAPAQIDTASKRFAVIVDEAHSSQSGETATALKGMLNKAGIEAAIAAQLSDEEDDDLSDEAKAAILRDALKRGRQANSHWRG
jgi:hypothetical protein